MQNKLCVLATVAGLVLAVAFARPSRAECYCRELDLFCWPSWCYTCCPDTYCPKPMPCVPCRLGGTCADCCPWARQSSPPPSVPTTTSETPAIPTALNVPMKLPTMPSAASRSR
jgi:hypothetical protein